ncbi:MAG: hypothetical protein ACK5CS_12130 [Bradyrhizobium sp.]
MYGSTGGRQVCFNLNIGMRNLQLLAMSISSSARFIPESMRSFRELALPLLLQGRGEILAVRRGEAGEPAEGEPDDRVETEGKREARLSHGTVRARG